MCDKGARQMMVDWGLGGMSVKSSVQNTNSHKTQYVYSLFFFGHGGPPPKTMH